MQSNEIDKKLEEAEKQIPYMSMKKTPYGKVRSNTEFDKAMQKYSDEMLKKFSRRH